MSEEDIATQRRQLERAIAAQETLRGTLDEAIVDATIRALRHQLDLLEPPPAVQQQRKMVTVLFADAVESTHLLRDLDPEENLAVMDSALQRMGAVVERHGGQVIRYMGDGFLAVFGLTRARENDPEMAVRSSMEILETSRRIAGEIERDFGISGFQVRQGINTGLVVAGGFTEAEGTIMGVAVNLAARLEQAAAPGSVLISSGTYTQVRGIFDLEPGGTLEMKGFSEPVPVFRVLRAKPRAFRLQTRGVEGVQTRMIGRELELEALQSRLRAVQEERTSRIITISGEAGLGKSRLLDEFAGRLDLTARTITVLKGRATLERMDLPYALLRDLFAFHFDVMEDESADSVWRKFQEGFGRVLTGDEQLGLKCKLAGQLLGYDFSDSPEVRAVLESPQQLRDRTFVFLADYLKMLAANGAAAIFLDDIHWADDSSLDMLLRLSHAIRDHPVLVVALTRPVLFERRPAWGQEQNHAVLPLHPLSRQESATLVGEVLKKVQNIPDALRDLVVGKTEGNPFYLEELVRMLLEDEVIRVGPDGWEVQPERLVQIRIPPSLTGVLQARLESLPEPERRVIQQASVVGRVFWDAAVDFIGRDSGDVSTAAAPDLVLILSALQTHEMIYPQEHSAFSGTEEFIFRHAILREVTYESVLLRKRRQFHGRIADWLIGRGATQSVDISGLIGSHLVQAGRDSEALQYLTRAAQSALSNYAIEEAAEFIQRALALVQPEDYDHQYILRMAQESVFRSKGDRERQKESMEVLDRIVAQLGDPRKMAELQLRWTYFYFYTSDFSAGLASADRAGEHARRCGDGRLQSEAEYLQAWFLMTMGETEQALRHAEIGLEKARLSGWRVGEGNHLNIRGLIAIGRGDYENALNSVQGFYEISRELGNLDRQIIALNSLSVVLTTIGQFEAALDASRKMLELCLATGNRESQSSALVNAGWAAQAMGDWQRARENLEAGVRLSIENEYAEGEAEALVWLGYTWIGINQPEKAIPLLEKALAIRSDLQIKEALQIEARAALAKAHLDSGEIAPALQETAVIRDFLLKNRSMEGAWEPLRIYLICAQVLRDAGDPDFGEVLHQALQILEERASAFQDERLRRVYLSEVPWHREIRILAGAS